MALTQPKPAAALIVNPNAGRLTDNARHAIVDALEARLGVETYATSVRDAAISLARDAATGGAEIVIAFGGDGHVNEVVNGIAGTSATLGIIPGGTMNVFSRALSIPQDPFEAIDRLVGAVDRPPRTVPLGRMDERYFTFSAGCGFDAEVAERVERYLRTKHRFGEIFFYWSAFRVLIRSSALRRPRLTLSGPFGHVPVSMAIACNAGPYAYLAGRAVDLAPHVRLEDGIDVFSLRQMKIEDLPLYAWRVAVSGDLIHHPDVFYASDLRRFEVTAERPFHRHVDGEPLPSSTSARFSVEPHALSVQL
jgi:diacylglycerol kinase family enzyme